MTRSSDILMGLLTLFVYRLCDCNESLSKRFLGHSLIRTFIGVWIAIEMSFPKIAPLELIGLTA